MRLVAFAGASAGSAPWGPRGLPALPLPPAAPPARARRPAHSKRSSATPPDKWASFVEEQVADLGLLNAVSTYCLPYYAVALRDAQRDITPPASALPARKKAKLGLGPGPGPRPGTWPGAAATAMTSAPAGTAAAAMPAFSHPAAAATAATATATANRLSRGKRYDDEFLMVNTQKVRGVDYTTRSGRHTKKAKTNEVEVAAFDEEYEDLDDVDDEHEEYDDDDELADYEVIPLAGVKRKPGRPRKSPSAVGGPSLAAKPKPKARATPKSGKVRKKPGPRKGVAPVNYAVAFADLVGDYPIEKRLRAQFPGGDDQVAVGDIVVDADGMLTGAVGASAAAALGLGDAEELRAGDKLVLDADARAAGLTPPQVLKAALEAPRAVVLTFAAPRSVYVKKLCGLKGVIIHPTKLWESVHDYGGYETVVSTHKWQRVRETLDLPNTSSSGYSLRRAFEQYFHQVRCLRCLFAYLLGSGRSC